MSNKYKIKIEEVKQPPEHLTGAAKRSTEAAYERAVELHKMTVATAHKIEAAVEQCENREVDAAMVANLFLLRDDWDDLKKKKRESLPVRYKFWVSPYVKPDNELAMHSVSFDQYPNLMAKQYCEFLNDAGVPMPEQGKFTVQYWEDAAARGC